MDKAQRSQETSRRILEAARDLFADLGYEATGVALICERAGVSKGAFYHHFETKQAVLLAILHEWLVALESGLNLWRDDDRPASEILVDGAEAAQPAFRGDLRTRRLLLEFWTLAGRDPAVAAAAHDPFHRYTKELAGVLRRGAAQGSLKDIDPEIGGRVFVSLAVGVLLSSLLDPARPDWGLVLNRGVGLLLDGLA